MSRDFWPGTGGWAKSLPDEEIDRQIDGGGPGNKLFEACLIERDRRAADRAAEAEMTWIKRTFWATIVSVLLAGGAIVATFMD